MLYLHGGGMILGSVAIFDGALAGWVAHCGAPMLSVEYRLAPEHLYPTLLEDANARLAWLATHAAELDVDPDRLAVMGDSRGGGLAAAVAILSRDRGGTALAHQILLYQASGPHREEANLSGRSGVYGDGKGRWS